MGRAVLPSPDFPPVSLLPFPASFPDIQGTWLKGGPKVIRIADLSLVGEGKPQCSLSGLKRITVGWNKSQEESHREGARRIEVGANKIQGFMISVSLGSCWG